ncbi:MAG: cellulase family glycosylhydrolase, partial [Nitrososphaeraceae archaeon]
MFNPNNLSARYRHTKIISFIFIATMLVVSSCFLNNSITNTTYAKSKDKPDKDIVNSNKGHDGITHEFGPHLGLNMKGYYTGLPQSREGFKNPYPSNYYASSFKAFSKAKIIDHVRYRVYWESYVKNPIEFIKELKHVAKLADRYGIKVIYDNHQFHTSSWLDVGSGTGFPAYLFNDAVLYKQDSGGIPKSAAAEAWWTNWWDRAIKSVNGTDGWRLQAEFLKKIVKTVDKHPSTLGYEILSEPQVHNKNQWTKIGKYNTFMTKELRKLTDKTLIYSMNIPIDLKSPI